ncbi:hypothetical protein DM02DRAFT_653773 [Periconia macrospinosa]|uniref:Uncharacterized protein n=1 Tax=Periconia macrospinosa TaxID=97972 RepID=A0A2V1DUX6_9PLEO|nr:hypothetical protein DM02DRAFT_653773 [Periconia macrospinosa]
MSHIGDLIDFSDDEDKFAGGSIKSQSSFGSPATTKSKLNPQATAFQFKPSTPKPNGRTDSFADLTILIKNKPWTSPAPSPETTAFQRIPFQKVNPLNVGKNTPHAIPPTISPPARELGTQRIKGQCQEKIEGEGGKPMETRDEAEIEGRLSSLKAELDSSISDSESSKIHSKSSDLMDFNTSSGASWAGVQAKKIRSDLPASFDSSNTSADAKKAIELNNTHNESRIVKQWIEPEKNASYDIGELLYQNTTSKNRLVQMGGEIRQHKIELEAKNQQIELLKADADAYKRNSSLKLSRQFQPGTGIDKHKEELEKRDMDIEHYRQMAFSHYAQIEHKHQEIRSKEKVLQSKEIEILNLQNHVSELETKLEALQQMANEKDDTLTDLQTQLTGTHKKLKEKTEAVDGMRNEIQELQKLLENNAKGQHKLEAGKHLRGAAHLVVPPNSIKLPKNVYPCSECFAQNKHCDSKTVCTQCRNTGSQCARWKCSLHHITSQCYEAPCRFRHDDRGWLVLAQQRPRW